MRDYPVEKLMRDASGMGICEATGEVVRMIAARGFETAVATG
jgi:alkylation response protein AidB-like acyl-CoA dehydrogenase